MSQCHLEYTHLAISQRSEEFLLRSKIPNLASVPCVVTVMWKLPVYSVTTLPKYTRLYPDAPCCIGSMRPLTGLRVYILRFLRKAY